MFIADWLQQYASALVAGGNFLLVIIWGVYLQMFYRQSQRQQDPTIVIHSAQGPAASSTCLLVNMSKEVLHVECVLAEIETEQETRVRQIHGYDSISGEDTQVRERLRQGPLQSGDFLLLGRLENILPESNTSPEGDEHRAFPPPSSSQVRALELHAVAFHGPTNDLIGARRRFNVEQQDGKVQIQPEALLTEQLTSRRDRARLRRWLRDSLARLSERDWPEPSQHDGHLSS